VFIPHCWFGVVLPSLLRSIAGRPAITHNNSATQTNQRQPKQFRPHSIPAVWLGAAAPPTPSTQINSSHSQREELNLFVDFVLSPR